MYLKCDHIEIMAFDKRDGIIEEHLESFLSRNQIGLKTLIKGSIVLYVLNSESWWIWLVKKQQ